MEKFNKPTDHGGTPRTQSGPVYGKAELALLYFPNSSPDVARAKLIRAINRNKAWSRAMARTGYRTTSKEFSPRQVEIIFHYYGEP